MTHRELLNYESAPWSHLVSAKMPLHSSVSMHYSSPNIYFGLTLAAAIYLVFEINSIMSFHYICNAFQHQCSL